MCSSTSLPEMMMMMSAFHKVHFQQVMISQTTPATEENMRKRGLRANLGMTHLRKTKPSSLSRHKPAGGTCNANCRFYTALRLNTISHSLIKETTCSTLWNFHSVCSLSSFFYFYLPLKNCHQKAGGGVGETRRQWERETVFCRTISFLPGSPTVTC